MTYVWKGKQCLHHKKKIYADGQILPELPPEAIARFKDSGQIKEVSISNKGAGKSPAPDLDDQIETLVGEIGALENKIADREKESDLTQAKQKTLEKWQAELVEAKEKLAKLEGDGDD